MTSLDVEEIKKYISYIPFVTNVISLEMGDPLICGKVEISFEELERPLVFEVEISPQYPLRRYDTETIKFINKDLIGYSHVMENGSICIHTSHDINLRDKLTKDFGSLKNWIVKYYINKEDDLNYEHIIVPECLRNNHYNSYLFTGTGHGFEKGDFGEVAPALLNRGSYKDKPIVNHIVQNFHLSSDEVYECKWSGRYRNIESNLKGLFVFIEDAPARHNRFAFDNWSDLSNFLDNETLLFLHNFEKRTEAKHRGNSIPLFIGYRTTDTEIHWQVAVLEIGSFPLRGVPERAGGRKTGRWQSELTTETISWAFSRDCSYDYFFGRGTLSKEIIDKKILILGIGAVGSIVATTLVRGGCKVIDLADYDVKEPENVCRSEYIFDFGINDKVKELANILTSISPFVEIESFKRHTFEDTIKIFHKDREGKEVFESSLNQYDIILDCTTDNDLMHVLNVLDLNCDLINLSITNHARELVCAFYPNIYRFVINQYTNILENDSEDLYTPVGCWSPTFRASYNDVNVLVQTAIKHINLLYTEAKPKNNFLVVTTTDDLFKIEIKEY